MPASTSFNFNSIEEKFGRPGNGDQQEMADSPDLEKRVDNPARGRLARVERVMDRRLMRRACIDVP